MIRLLTFYLLFKLNFITVRKLHEATFKNFFQDLSATMIEKLVTKFVSDKLNALIYQPAFLKLEEAKNEGFYTGILSSSPDFLVEKIASKFKVDLWDSTIYQKNKCNHFSHITNFMDGHQKAKTLLRFTADLQICKNNVTAFTDSFLDLPLLQAVGNPVGVNPDYKLKALCQKYHWPII